MAPSGLEIRFVNYTNAFNQESKRISSDSRKHIMLNHIRKRRQAAKENLEAFQRQKRLICAAPARYKDSMQGGRGEDVADINTPAGRADLISHVHGQNLVNAYLLPRPATYVSPPCMLPIDEPYVRGLMQWHFNPVMLPAEKSRIDSPALTTYCAEQKLQIWIAALDDIGLFHVLLCLNEAQRAAFTGMKKDVRYYYHKREAIKAVKTLVSNPEREMKDSSISLLACLAATALLDDGYEVSRAHTQAIANICLRRNAVSTLAYCHYQQAIWHDARLAWERFERPVFEYSGHYAWASFNESIIAKAHDKTMQTITLLPCIPTPSEDEGTVGNEPGISYLLFNRAHQFCLANECRSDENPRATGLAMESNFYWTFYKLSIILAESCGPSAAPVHTMIDGPRGPGIVLVLALQLFLMALVPSQVHMKLYSSCGGSIEERVVRDRLSGILLQCAEDDLVEIWLKHSGHLESLLWTLAVCSEWSRRSALGKDVVAHGDLQCLLARMARVLHTLCIHEKDDYERVLVMFPWASHFSNGACSGLWELLKAARTVR